jgi:SAM-dependent methyltransferase
MNPTWTNWRKANFFYFQEKLSSLPHEKTLLDLGSGAEQFADLFHQYKYTPVDFEQFHTDVVVADLTKAFPFGSEYADIVTLSNTLEHIPNPEHFIAECARVLKTGGVMIGTVPFLLGEHQAPYDFNRYTHFQLQRFLEISGFTEVEVVPLGAQVDVYNTIELKVFDELRKTSASLLLELVRLIRRVEMRIIRRLFREKAGTKLTEGYGFYGVKK